MAEGLEHRRHLGEVAKRLASDTDFAVFISEIEKEWAGLISKLRLTQTTDPRIAEIQAKLDTLDGIVGRVGTWVTEARIKYTDEGKEGEDYSHG